VELASTDTALEIGCGLGRITRVLAARAQRVLALDISEEMLARAREHNPELNNVEWILGDGVSLAVPDGSVDAVLAGQSAHWFDLDLAMPEIARVLAPGGVFAGLWNADDDRVDWVSGLHRAMGRRTMAAFTSFADDEDGITAWLRGPGAGLFWPPEDAGFEHGQVRTAESLIATMRTHSMFLIMEPAEREAVLTRVREHLAAAPHTAAGEFTMPLWTIALRTVRR